MGDNVLNLIIELKYNLYLRSKGGKGSGGWGHSGRKGKRGGSKAGSGGLSKIGANPRMHPYKRKKLAKKVTEEKQLVRKAKATRMKVLAVKDKFAQQITNLEGERKDVYAKQAPFRERTVRLVDNVVAGEISMADYKKEDALIKKESAQAVKGITDFHAKENKMLKGTIQKQRDLIYAKGDPAKLNIEFTGNLDKDHKESIQKGIDEFSKMVGKGSMLDDQTIKVSHATDGRSFNTGGNIAMASGAGTLSTIHELGHSLEFIARDRLKAAPSLKANVHAQTVDFLNRRTKGEKAQSLRNLTGDNNYGKNEVAKPDKFSDPYTGKIYPQGTTEILSIGMERMWDNPAKFAKDDPDFFDFTLTTLENAKARGY